MNSLWLDCQSLLQAMSQCLLSIQWAESFCKAGGEGPKEISVGVTSIPRGLWFNEEDGHDHTKKMRGIGVHV